MLSRYNLVGIFMTKKDMDEYKHPFVLQKMDRAFCLETQTTWQWNGAKFIDTGKVLLGRGDTGEKGDQGAPMVWEDLTPSMKEELTMTWEKLPESIKERYKPQLITFDDLSDNQKLSITMTRDKMSDDQKDQLAQRVYAFMIQDMDKWKLKLSDMSEEDRNSLKGQDGKSLTFDDLDMDQKAKLTGPKGDRLQRSDLDIFDKQDIINSLHAFVTGNQ